MTADFEALKHAYQRAEIEVSIDVDALMDQMNKRASYARVSEIIGKQTESEMRQIPIDKLVNASIRGHKIHAYCTAYMKGLCVFDVPESLLPYYNAFVEWADANIQSLLLCTTRLYDDVKRFSGEPDMVILMKNGRKALVDIKTNAIPTKSWDIQLAAYSHLCKLAEIEHDEIFILHLKKKTITKKEREDLDNLPPLEVYAKLHVPENLSQSWDIFSSALTCYDYFHRKDVKS